MWETRLPVQGNLNPGTGEPEPPYREGRLPPQGRTPPRTGEDVNVASVAIIQFQYPIPIYRLVHRSLGGGGSLGEGGLVIGNIGTGNILTLATFSP